MSQRPRIYLDHAATTPILPAAKAAMVAAMDRWANPSSPHAEGRAARAALEDARERIKRALGWEGELIFTSGATEAIDIAIGRTDRRVLVSAVEHDAVFRAAPDGQVMPIGSDAHVDRDALDVALKAGSAPLVAIQHVNSETGVAQPIDELTRQVRGAGGLLVCDCSQSAAKIQLPDADMVIVSAHKLGGPPGIGALLVRDLAALAATGGQEFGYRGGTSNTPAAMGFAAAVEDMQLDSFPHHCDEPRPMPRWMAGQALAWGDLEPDLLKAGLVYQPQEAVGAEDLGFGVPHILAMTMPGVPAQVQLIQFDAAGIAVSVGSACSSGSLQSSRALAGFGVSPDDAARTIRVSFGWSTTAAELRAFARAWLAIAGARKSCAA